VFDVKRETQKFFKRFKRFALNTFKETFGNKRLSEITYLDIETFRNRRKATPTRTGGIRADATVNRNIATLKHIFNKAVEWGMLAPPLF
jgi:hypothetical protein